MVKMSGDTNKDFLSRIEYKLDSVNKDVYKMKNEISLEITSMRNSHEKRFIRLESYLHSNPNTNEEGVVEKLNNLEKSFQNLERKSQIQGAKYGLFASAILSFVWWIFQKMYN